MNMTKVSVVKLFCVAISLMVGGIIMFYSQDIVMAQDRDADKQTPPVIGSGDKGRSKLGADDKEDQTQAPSEITETPPETKELLEQCVTKLEKTGERLSHFSQRFGNWKQNNCAPKDDFEELVGWRRIVRDMINTRISRGLKRCNLRLGNRGCQILEYDLTASGLQVTGKLLASDCAIKTFKTAIKDFSSLRLDFSGLTEISECISTGGDEDGPWAVIINTKTQRADCVGRKQADRSYHRLPPEKKCRELGETVADWESFSKKKRFWVLGDDESVNLCYRSTGNRWRIKSRNLTGNCALLLLDKRKKVKPDDAPIVMLQAGGGGHFNVKAYINGHLISLMVDTGATSVSLRYEDAVAIGLASRLKFTNKASTANGIASVAPVSFDRIQIGEIIVDNVQGSVSKRGALNKSLLGMSFIKRLSRFDMNGTTLTMAK